MNTDICIFGEVLFDFFPDGEKVLGGAPFNVAWHLNAFGQAPFFISRIGNDPEGIQVLQAMLDWGMNTIALQRDHKYPTGQVNIGFIENEPHYDIVSPCAYDNIEDDDLKSLKCGFIYHGSLALRHEHSRQSLLNFIACQEANIFVDVNLRAPWWQKDEVLQMMRQADWVKLNTEELNLLLPSGGSNESRLKSMTEKFNLQGLILTHGAEGAELMTADQQHYRIQPQSSVKLMDSVGAGDAFSSIMILGLMNNWPMQTTLQRAQDFASAITGQRGATVSELAFYRNFIHEWGLD